MPLLRQLLVDHYFALNTSIAKDQTRRQYHFALDNLRDLLGREPMLDDLTDDNVTKLMIWLRDIRKLDPRTCNDRRGRINALWRWLANREFLTRRPTNCPLPVPAKLPTAWMRDELTRLIIACRDAPGSIGQVPASVWWLAYHGVAWDTAARPGEILALRWEWLDWSSRWIDVPASVRKGGLKPARYRFQPDTIAALTPIRRPSGELLPWPYCREYLWIKYRELLQAAGLPDTRDCMPHKLRRSHASWLASAGADASLSLGHSDSATTRAHYLDQRISASESSALLPFRLLGETG